MSQVDNDDPVFLGGLALVRRCDECGRESSKHLRALRRDYNWTVTRLDEWNEWIRCGTCNQIRNEAIAKQHGKSV